MHHGVRREAGAAEARGGGRSKAAAGGGVAIADASRQFLTIEVLAPSSGASERSYFGRTAFRPRALSAVTAAVLRPRRERDRRSPASR